MNEIESKYRESLRARETRDIEDFLNQPDEYPVAPEVLGPPSPASAGEAPAAKKSAVGAGIAATKENLGAGFAHFTKGLLDHAQSRGGPSNTVQDVSSLGEQLLGGLSVFMALPMGVGAALKQAMINYAPGLEKTIALPGSAAAPLRSFLGLPGFLLDPEQRKIFFSTDDGTLSEEDQTKKQAMKDAVFAPMTFGELFENAAALAVPGLILRGRRGAAATAPEPTFTGPLNLSEIGRGARAQLAQEAFERTQGPQSFVDVAEPLRVQAATRSTIAPKPTKSTVTPETLADALGKVASIGEGKEAGKSAQGGAKSRTKPPAKAEEPPAAKPKEEKTSEGESQPFEEPFSPPEYPDYPTQLADALETGTKVAEEIIVEEIQVSRGVDPRVAKIEKEIRAFERQRDRGIKVDEPAEVREAERQIELLKKDLVKTQGKGGEAPIEPQARRPQSRGKRPRLGQEARFNEKGGVDVPLLARMAVGAAIGGTQGDTPEERIAFMLGGIILGAKGPALARKLATAFKTDPHTAALLDTTNPKMPATSPPVDPLAGTTKVIKDIGQGESASLVRKILAADDTTVLTIEELRASKQIEMRVRDRIAEIVKSTVEDGTSPNGELRSALALARSLHDNISSTGRRMGATGGRGMDRYKMAVARVDKLAKEWDPSRSERDLAVALDSLGDIEKVGLFARLNYAIPETLTQTMYGSMLFGKALVKNAVGNGVMVPLSIVDRSLASLKFWDPNRPALSEGPQGVVAMFEVMSEQLRMLNKWDALGQQARELGASHVEVLPRGFEALADISRESGAPMLAKGFDFLNSMFNLAPEVMQRTDGMAKAVHGRLAIQWEAMQKARGEGLEGTAFWNRTGELVKDYSQLGEDALIRIKEFRDQQTFTAPFEGAFLNALQAGPENAWLNLVYRLGFLPFVRTAVRLADVGAQYTPGLNALSKTFWTEVKAGGPRRAVAEARLATGAMVIGSFSWLAMQGLVTGNLPATFKERRALEDAGRPPQSFWDPLSQKYRSYQGMEPLTQWISTGADFAYLLGQMPERDASNIMTAAQVAISQNININQFMQAVSEFADIVKNGRTDSQFEQSVEFIRRRLTAFIPAAVKELTGTPGEKKRVMTTGAFDEDKSPSAVYHRELRALIDEYKKGFGVGPGESGEHPLIKTRRNMFTGDPLLNDVWPFNPFTTTLAQPAPWAAEIQRLDGAGLSPLPDWVGKKAGADIGLTDKPTPPGVRLTPQELDRWEVLMTQGVKDAQGTLVQSLNNLVDPKTEEGKWYAKQSDLTKREALQARWTEFKERAEGKLFEEFPLLARDFLEKKGVHQIERMPPTEQDAARGSLEIILRKSQVGTQVAP